MPVNVIARAGQEKGNAADAARLYGRSCIPKIFRGSQPKKSRRGRRKRWQPRPSLATKDAIIPNDTAVSMHLRVGDCVKGRRRIAERPMMLFGELLSRRAGHEKRRFELALAYRTAPDHPNTRLE